MLLRRIRWVLLLAGFPALASAQVKKPVLPADSARRAPPPADSTAPDTTSRSPADSADRIPLRRLRNPGVDGLRPAGTRWVFSRDSIDWAAAQTVGELLDRIPGIYLWHAGWLGRAELPNFFARGSSAVEYVLDGWPMAPVGPDSLALDPSRFSLFLLDRVEVEVSPATMRVLLFTPRHDRAAPRTRIGISAGDRSIGRYAGSFERRYPGGLGLGLAADYFSVNAPVGGTGAASLANVWSVVTWAPGSHLGVQAQFTAQILDRKVLLGEGETDPDTLEEAVKGTRGDAQVRVTWQGREDGLGPRFDLMAGRTTWSSDDLRQSLSRLGASASLRHPTWSAEATAWYSSRWTPFDGRAALGWSPLPPLALAIEYVGQQHQGERGSSWITARGSLALPFGLHLEGSASDGHRVANPALLADSARRFTDVSASAGIANRWLGVTAGWRGNDAWRPTGFVAFRAVSFLQPMPRTEWLTAQARLTPLNWLSFEGRFEHPQAFAMPDGAPPKHWLGTVTIRSKFFRNFPSGIFDLKVQGVLEHWGDGIIGRAADSTAIGLPAATFLRGIVQLQIGPFIAYYDRVNMRGSRLGYVPGYLLPTLGSTFGVRWNFAN